MNYSVVRIPLSPVARKYYEHRFASKKDADGYLVFDKNHAFGMKIIHSMDVWWGSWELPQVTGSMLKVKLPISYWNRGIPAPKLKDLSKILEAEAMESLVMSIACAAQYPGISVTEAIITVMATYDISDEEYRSDSMRRHFDRYCEEVMGEPFKAFSYKINAAMKQLYEKLVKKHATFESLPNHG